MNKEFESGETLIAQWRTKAEAHKVKAHQYEEDGLSIYSSYESGQQAALRACADELAAHLHAPEGERRPPTPNDPPLLHETTALNPWRPETDPLRLAVLGKLVEELSEAAAIVARCQIQGIDESEPVTKVPNRLALEKELADVRATLHMAIDFFGLDAAAIAVREERKVKHLTAWHGLIRAAALPRAPAPPVRRYFDVFMEAINNAIRDGVAAADAALTPEQREKVRKFDEMLRLVDSGMEPDAAARQVLDDAAPAPTPETREP